MCGQRAEGGPQLPLHVLLTAPLQVEQALDTGVLGQLDGPGGLVLSALRDPSGSLSPLKGRAVLCLLGALVGKRTPGGGAGGLRRTLSGLGSRCGSAMSSLGEVAVSCIGTSSESHWACREANTHESPL